MITFAETCRPVTDLIGVSINNFFDCNLRTTCKIIFWYLRLYSSDSFLKCINLTPKIKAWNTLILLVHTYLIIQWIARLNENCDGYKNKCFTSLLNAFPQQIILPHKYLFNTALYTCINTLISLNKAII